MIKRCFYGLSLAAMVFGLSLGNNIPRATAAQDDVLKFNYGAPTADYFSLYVAKDLGLFQKVGLDPSFYFFQSGAPLLAGLKSNSLDVVTTGIATVFALGQHIPLKFLFWQLDHAAAEGLVVAPNSGISSYKDITKAKTLAAPAGTCAQVSLDLIARKLGMTEAGLSVVNIAPPLYANAFKSGAIQAGIAWSPYSLGLEAIGYKVVNWDADYVPEGGVCPGLTAVRPDFLKQHPELGSKLVQVNAMALEAIKKNPQLAIDALVKYLSVSPAVAKASYERDRIPTFAEQLDPKSQYSMTSRDGGLAKKLYVVSQILYETKTIPAPLSWDVIREAIDPSYLRKFMSEQQHGSGRTK